jgi:hypothetical protein
MDQTKEHFSPHLRGHAYQNSKKSGGASSSKPLDKKPGSEIRDTGPKEHGAAGQHAKEMFHTKPHPMTHVHAVMITHHDGGAAKTHTHHDDGSIEEQDHSSLAEAKQHADMQLPDEAANDHDGDEPEYTDAASDDGSDMGLGKIA